MTNQTQVSEIPAVKGGVVANLQIDGAMRAAEFYQRAFGAALAAARPVDDKGQTMHVHLYGAQVAMPVAEMLWGDRYGELRDPFGVPWSMNQRKR